MTQNQLLPVFGAAFFLLTACGSDSATPSSDSCREACETLASCGQQSCPFSASCTAVEACDAACVKGASCDALAGRDATGHAQLLACRAKCFAVPPTDGGPSTDGAPSTDGSKPVDQGQPDHLAGLAPDLLINSLQVTVAGNTATFTVRVCNVGESTSASFELGLYHQLPPAGCNTSFADHLTINGLGSTACTTKTFTRSNMSASIYQVWARVDPGCKLPELDEGNNSASKSYVVGGNLPDLSVKSFHVKASGSTVTYTVEVCNNHIAVTGFVKIGLFWSASAPQCTNGSPDGYLSITGLAANACKTLTHVRKNVDPGTYTQWVLLDYSCGLKEALESNNAASVTFTVDGPDIFIKSVTATAGQKVIDYVIEVCHSGLAVSGNDVYPWIGMHVDEDGTSPIKCKKTPDDDTVVAVVSGGCKTVTFQRTSTYPGSPPNLLFSPGTHTDTFFVDYKCTVTETNESNNMKSVTYSVPGLDLVVQKMSAKVASWNSSLVVYSAEICNLGVAGHASYKVYAYKGGSTPPKCGDSGGYSVTWYSGPLRAGWCTNVEANFAAGTGKVWFLVDATCQTDETNENNNYDSATL